jgi:hypothetical protein
MQRFVCLVVVLCIACVLSAAGASATTYYIAANGSDSNSGTSKTTPWLHAPGMTNCSGTCASTAPQPGDSFIFRGGDTWHYGNSGLTPFVGGTSPHWNWNWAGSSSNCQLDGSAGAVTKTSCIYIGVDQSWFGGSSWARPIMNMDNPLTTSRPSSCAFDQDGQNMLLLSRSYLILDNFEWVGLCWNASPNAGVVTTLANMVEITNNYFHGWTYGSGSTIDQFPLVSCSGAGCTGAEIVDHNVFDGSDSSLGATPGQASGKATGAGSELAYNVFWHVSNGDIAGTSSLASVHDNLFYYMLEPQGSIHGNIIEWLGVGPKASTYFYNNLMFATNEGEGIDMYTGTSGSAYVFNNISYLYRATFGSSSITNGNEPNNCYMGEVSGTWHFFNNTTDSPCSFTQARGSISLTFQNNHFIGFSSSTVGAFANTGSANTDNGGEVFQSEATANGQGYTTTNDYAPTAGSNATVGAGANLTSFCSGIGNSLAASACTKGYGGVTYNRGNHTAVPNTATARPSSGAWDAGAHQFSSGTASRPNPPTGLTATVQ